MSFNKIIYIKSIYVFKILLFFNNLLIEFLYNVLPPFIFSLLFSYSLMDYFFPCYSKSTLFTKN